jgi:tripartite-type tricarboxylate transporter receptor subunit TctC
MEGESMIKTRQHGVRWCAIVLALACAPGVHAQSSENYPVRPVRFVIAYPPGGGSDAVARVIAPRLGEVLGQQVVIDNRGGAATIIGMDIVAKSAPDGYTIGLATSNLAVNPALYQKLPYDAAKDFTYATLLAKGLYVLAVHPSVAAKSVKELIALLKSGAGKFTGATAGVGTPMHLGLEQLNALLGVKVVAVNYKGAGPAAAAVIGGEAQIMFATYSTIAGFIPTGRLRVLAVTSAERSPTAPDLPTAVEAGLPGLVVGEWYGIVMAARTAKGQIERLDRDLRAIVAEPDVKERFGRIGVESIGQGPREFGAFVKSETARWEKIIRSAGLKAE